MENIKSAISLNLSNQANTCKSTKTTLSQTNYFVILGLDCLDSELTRDDPIPLSISIDKSNQLSINGVYEEILKGPGIHIYTDRKITTSDDDTERR